MQSANDISVFRRLPAIFGSLAAGVLLALPVLFDRAGAVRSVGCGLLPGLASWGHRLAALAFDVGGWWLADALRLALAAAPWSIGFLVIFGGLGRLRGRPRTLGNALAWFLVLGASAAGIWQAFSASASSLQDPQLLAPLALAEMAQAGQGRVFVNASARPLVAPYAPGLTESTTGKMSSELATSPEKWRSEDRSKPFSAVLIGGSVSEAKPLFRHLLGAPDWYLARVDNQGMLFLRGQKPDLAASPIPDFKNQRDRAIYLAQYALNLEAAGFKTLAAAAMEEAMSLAGKDYEVLFRAASLSASQSLWERARKQSAGAAKARPRAYEANYLLALSLLETRACDKAFDSASKLKRLFPDDPNVLLLHARAARGAHDYNEETKTLEHLLGLAEADGSPTARIHVFLAQSWAQRGFPEQATSHYKTALAEGLSPEETRDVRTSLAAIEDKRLKQ